MNEEINVVSEEVVANVVPEVIPQVVKVKPDPLQIGVKGLCVWGAVSLVGAAVLVGKKIHKKINGKKVVDIPADGNFKEVETEESTNAAENKQEDKTE